MVKQFKKVFEKKETKFTESDRRRIAFSEGKEYQYVVCPLCCMNRSINKVTEKGFSSFDIHNETGKGFFVQIRIGGTSAGKGRATGFYSMPEKSITLTQAKELTEYIGIIDDIRLQCKRILQEIGE